MENDQATLSEPEVTAVESEAPEQSGPEFMAEQLASMRAKNAEESESQDDQPKVDRARDEKGKFAKEKQAKAPQANQAAPEAKPAEQSQPAEKPAEPVHTAIQPPNGLTAEGKAEFMKASPALQREIVRRENDFHKYYKETNQAAQYGRSMYAALQPFEQTIKSWGVSPDKAVQALFNADHKLTHGSPAEKLQAFAALAKGYGVDLSQGLPEQQYVDPNFAWMQQQNKIALQTAQQANQQLQQMKAQIEHERQVAAQAELNSTLAQVKQNKPYFDELSHDIGLILQARINKGEDLSDMQKAVDQAYEAAMWQSPKHRAELLAKQQSEAAAAAAQKRTEDANKAKAARQASSVNVAKRGTLQPQDAIGNSQEFIREELSRMRAR